MYEIIHLSPEGCFTPARGKSMQKNREVREIKVAWDIYADKSGLINLVIKHLDLEVSNCCS